MKERLLRVLRLEPGLFFCSPCLAKRADVQPFAAQSAWADLVADTITEIAQGLCAECLNVRTVVRFKSRASN